MAYRRSLNTTGSIQTSAVWRDGKIAYHTAWFTFQPGRIGRGPTPADAIRNIPPQKQVEEPKP